MGSGFALDSIISIKNNAALRGRNRAVARKIRELYLQNAYHDTVYREGKIDAVKNELFRKKIREEFRKARINDLFALFAAILIFTLILMLIFLFLI